MKFGETLRQRSIPQWAHYNVDYDELKHLIKERTSETPTTPVSIPGQGLDAGSTWEVLDNELFGYLYEQHERVSLFTKSKYGEIERRLDHLKKQLPRLEQSSQEQTHVSTPIQQTRRFQKAVEDAEVVAQEIQSLSRYASAQRLAFKKILKKYKKWTGSSKLSMRVNDEVLDQPTSCLRPDFTPLLDQMSYIQTSLRALTLDRTARSVTSSKNKDIVSPARAEAKRSPLVGSTSASRLHDVFGRGSKLDIDTALATLPLGRYGGRAMYWVHPDNVEELRVLLLLHLQDQDTLVRRSVSRSASTTSISSKPRSPIDGASSTSDCVHAALFDNLDTFIEEQNAIPISRIEDTSGSCALRVPMYASWNHESKTAQVATAHALKHDLQKFEPLARLSSFEIISLRKKDLPKLFKDMEDSTSPIEETAGSAQIQSWTNRNTSIDLLAEIVRHRSRFHGINNDTTSGIWATLDESITMSKSAESSLGQTEAAIDHVTLDQTSAVRFPHTVLEMRWENERMPDLINILNGSYLLERVRGFSLQTHAIYVLHAQKTSREPIWMALLEKDIRKVPSAKSKPSRKRSTDGGKHVSAGSSKAASTSAPSTDDRNGSGFSAHTLQSSATSLQNTAEESAPPTSAVSSKQKAKAPIWQAPSRHPRPSVKRYWNEFDDGSDAENNDVYAIYVDPEASSGFPGLESISHAAASVINVARLSGSKLEHWLHLHSHMSNDGSREPLLGDTPRQDSFDVEDTTDSDEGDSQFSRHRDHVKAKSSKKVKGHHQRNRHQQSREIGIFRAYVGCFAAAFILLLVTGILQATGRHKAAFEVNVGVITGVVGSVCLGIVGTSMMLLRKEKLSWSHRIAVGLAFCIVCITSGILLALIDNAQ